MSITETALEMHYHKPLMDLFRETYGLGKGKFQFFKYSQRREAYIGFDQAYVSTTLTDKEFFEQLKSSAIDKNYKLSTKFIAYFLQFKVVSELQRRSKTTPPQVSSKPHYRASLDTTKNNNTGFSQHELLFNLSKNQGADVYYACPMIFDKASLYDVNVDLDTLRLVDLQNCPSNFTDNGIHNIYFDKKDADPLWCSEPVLGNAKSPKQFVEEVLAKLQQTSPIASVRKLQDILLNLKSIGNTELNILAPPHSINNGLGYLADSLTIIRFDEEESHAVE